MSRFTFTWRQFHYEKKSSAAFLMPKFKGFQERITGKVLKVYDTSPPSPSPNYIWNACLVAISWGLGGVGGRSQSIKRPPQEHPPPAPTYPSVSLTFEKSISASDKYVWVVHKYKSTFLWVPLSCPQPIFSTPSALICHQSAALKRAVTVTIAIEKQNNLSVVLLEFESHIENGTDAWIQQSESAFVQY